MKTIDKLEIVQYGLNHLRLLLECHTAQELQDNPFDYSKDPLKHIQIMQETIQNWIEGESKK